MGGERRPDVRPDGLDHLLARLAGVQHGVVSRRQLLDAGASRRALERRLERGSLQPLHRGVYAVGHRALTMKSRWMAAVLACGPGAVLSHRSAAACWGLLSPFGSPEVLRPTKFRQRDGILARRAAVPADERAVREGIPLTTVSRTIFDLSALGRPRDLERALHEAEVRQLRDRVPVAELLRRYPGRPGSRLLRELVGRDSTEGVPMNRFEDAMADLILLHRLPTPRFNADLVVRDRQFKPDCLWPERKLIVELDGGAVHRTQKGFESDRKRDRFLLAAGFRTIRVTWRQLRHEPESVVTDIRIALAAPSLHSPPHGGRMQVSRSAAPRG